MNVRHWILIGFVAAIGIPAGAQEGEGVAVTVYNGNYGVVRETRNLDIGADGMVRFTDVPQRIDATTVHFKSVTDPAAQLLEQNYQFDLVSADKLLGKYIDNPIDVVCPGKMYSGTLLSYDGGQIVLREDEGGLVMVQRPDNVRDIRFKMLPEGLLTRPTLVWKIATAKPGRQLAEVTYQTGGINWHSEYVLVLGAGDETADLSGWVSIDNRSGKTYKQAKLKCIAGDVRREQQTVRRSGKAMDVDDLLDRGGMEQKAFFEYHMYTLPRPSTIADNETKQLEMFAPVHEMKVEKKYLYNPLKGYRWRGGRQQDRSYGVTGYKKVQVFIEFQNSKDNNLGIPLPAGKVRVYKQDPDDKALEFIGEQSIDHTPTDERLSLEIGNAFDIVGERKQTGFQVDVNAHWMKETIEVKVRNHKEQDVVVRVKEPMYRWNNWRITDDSQNDFRVEQKEMDAFNVAWDLPVKAKEEAILTYTVVYTW